MADQVELWCNCGDQALGGAKGRGGRGQARGFGGMEEEEALVDAKIVRGIVRAIKVTLSRRKCEAMRKKRRRLFAGRIK